MPISNEFKNRINDLVSNVYIDRKIRKSDLPKMIGIDYSSLSNAMEYGIVPTPRIAMRMADYFECSIPYLLGLTDDEHFTKSKKNESFPDRIDLLCEAKKTDYAKVCKECKLYRGYLARWISHRYIPSWEFLDLLADYFDVSVDYLLGRTDDR